MTTTTETTTPTGLTEHPAWCARQKCYESEGGKGVHRSSPLWLVAAPKRRVSINYAARTVEGFEQIVEVSGAHLNGYLPASSIGRLAEALQLAAVDLAAQQTARPVPAETTLGDGRRAVVNTTTEVHPAWCSAQRCMQEPGEAPAHLSEVFECATTDAQFDASIVQDALGHPEIMSDGPNWDVPINPESARTYARFLLRVADVAEGKQLADL